MRLERRLVAWGLLFIVAGAVVLAAREGGLDSSLVARWPELWPVLLIAIGLSVLLSRTSGAWLGSIAVAIVVGVMAGGLLVTGAGDVPSLVGCGNGPAQPFAAQSGSLGSPARLDVQFDCGSLTVDTLPGSEWHIAGNDGDGTGPTITADTASVTIKSPSSHGFRSRGSVAWTLDVPETPTLQLGVTLNAGHGDLELQHASLASLDATLNAGELSTFLGSSPVSNAINLTVNAGTASLGTQAMAGAMNLSLNAGSLDVCVPTGAPLRVRWSGALASHDLDSLGLVKLDSRTWASQGFDASSPHLELDVSANAGSFNLNLGGSCGA